MAMTDEEWLNGRLAKLIQGSAKITDGGPTTDYKYHTALKLVAIQYYAETFAKVVRKQVRDKRADGAVFIDLFAGTGAVKFKGSSHGDRLPGSSCCVAQVQEGFDHLVCVEKSPDRREALQGRLGRILGESRFDVLGGDCNEAVEDVISCVRRRFKNPIVLVFADPEGLHIKARTLQRIGGEFERCDFVINVNSAGVDRVVAKARKGVGGVRRSLEEYMNAGIEELLAALECEPPHEYYHKEIVERALGKPIGSTIKIMEKPTQISYYLLGCTRPTHGGAGYAKAFRVLKDRFNSLTGDTVRVEMEKLQNRQETLDGGWGA